MVLRGMRGTSQNERKFAVLSYVKSGCKLGPERSKLLAPSFRSIESEQVRIGVRSTRAQDFQYLVTFANLKSLYGARL